MHQFFKELRHGWRDLVGAVIGLGLGIASYNPVSSFFFRALEKEFGWSKTAAAVSLVALPVTAAVLPIAGMLVDRFGVRRVALASTLLMSACFMALSSMTGALWMFYVSFLALNVMGCPTGPVSYTQTIAARFQRSRGTALAVALMGIACAGIILPPLLAQVFAVGGWRSGYRFFAGAVLLAGLAAFFLMRDVRKSSDSSRDLPGVRLKEAISTQAFWLLGLAIFFISAASLGFVSQFQSIMIEKGLPPSVAPLLLSALAAAVFASRLVVGWALDARPPEWVAATALSLAAAGICAWLFGGSSMPAVVAAVLLLGLSIGAELDLLSFFCARLFGLRHYGAVYGGLGVFFYMGIAAGGIGYGAIRDRTGVYTGAIAVSGALFVLSALLFLRLRSSHVPRETAERVASVEALSPRA